MKLTDKDTPLEICVSFSKFFEKYKEFQKSENLLLRDRAKKLLQLAKSYPALSTGMKTKVELTEYADQIDLILEDSFPHILEQNEIKFGNYTF